MSTIKHPELTQQVEHLQTQLQEARARADRLADELHQRCGELKQVNVLNQDLRTQVFALRKLLKEMPLEDFPEPAKTQEIDLLYHFHRADLLKEISKWQGMYEMRAKAHQQMKKLYYEAAADLQNMLAGTSVPQKQLATLLTELTLAHEMWGVVAAEAPTTDYAGGIRAALTMVAAHIQTLLDAASAGLEEE
jgi:chromosome segregation ATPase